MGEINTKPNCSAKGDCEHFAKGKKFCLIDYTQNPKTEEGTRNVLENGGEVCRFNPYKRKILKERRMLR